MSAVLRGDPLVDHTHLPGLFFCGAVICVALGEPARSDTIGFISACRRRTGSRFDTSFTPRAVVVSFFCVCATSLGAKLHSGSLADIRLADAREGEGVDDVRLAARLDGCSDEAQLLDRVASELLRTFPDACAVAVATLGDATAPQPRAPGGGTACRTTSGTAPRPLGAAVVAGRRAEDRHALSACLPHRVGGPGDATAAGFAVAAASRSCLSSSDFGQRRPALAFSDWAAARAAGLGPSPKLVTVALRPFSGPPLGFITLASSSPASSSFAGAAPPPPPSGLFHGIDGGHAAASAAAALSRLARAAAEAAAALRSAAARALAADVFPPHGACSATQRDASRVVFACTACTDAKLSCVAVVRALAAPTPLGRRTRSHDLVLRRASSAAPADAVYESASEASSDAAGAAADRILVNASLTHDHSSVTCIFADGALSAPQHFVLFCLTRQHLAPPGAISGWLDGARRIDDAAGNDGAAWESAFVF